MRTGLALMLAGSGVLVSCTDLVDIDPNVCGNSVLDAGEDCDGHDDPSGAHCALVGEPNACRFTCDPTDAETKCPTGYACGADGVCSRPSNTFTESTLFDSIGGDVVAAGDFDGDGVNDLAIIDRESRTLHVELMAPGLASAFEQVLPADPTNALTVGLVDGDARADIVLGSQGALSSLTAAEGRRELVGTAFASYSFTPPFARVVAAPARASAVPPTLDPLDVLAPDADSEAIFIGSTTSQLFLRNPYTGKTVLKELAEPMSSLGALVRAPVLDRTGGDPCDEVALAYHADGSSGGRVAVWPLCFTNGEPIYTALDADCADTCPTVLDFADDIGGIFPVELDGDAGRELLIVRTPKGSQEGAPEPVGLSVVEATGVDVTTTTPPASLNPLVDLVATKKIAGAVLSVLDLDDDGLLDVIGSHGVFLQKADGSFFRAASPLAGSSWSQAVTGDFNGDGRLDVVAAPDGGLDLDLALGSDSSYLNPIVLPTDGFAGLLVAGDFDGDGVTDLALRERDPETPTEVVDDMAVPVCSALDDLVIRFGSQVGPGDRTIVARAAGIEQIYPGRLPRLDKRDSIEDFGAVLHCAADGEAENRVSVFYGALSRQVAAPFLLNDQLDDPSQPLSPPFIIPFQPRATTTTSVGDKHIAAAVGTSIAAFRPPSVPTGYPEPSEVGLFVLESGDAGPFSGAHLVPMLQKLPGVDALADTAFHIGMGDLDGDGATDGQQEVVVTIDRTLYIARNWSTYGGDSDQGSIAQAKEDVDAFELPGSAGALLVADLDGDGNADIAVAGGTSDAPFLVVMFGGDPNQQVSIDTGGVGVTALAALPVYSMAADAPPTPERLSLLFSSDAAPVQSVTISSDRSVGAPATLQQKKFPHVNGLLVTDVDGDRFEDVVVLTPTSTSVIQRQPTLAGNEQGGAE